MVSFCLFCTLSWSLAAEAAFWVLADDAVFGALAAEAGKSMELAGAVGARGIAMMFFFEMLAGGGWSLKTRRPMLSIQEYCAKEERLAVKAMPNNRQRVVCFMSKEKRTKERRALQAHDRFAIITESPQSMALLRDVLTR
jgi:hypothetical protein